MSGQMITTRRAPQTQRLLVAAFVLSIALHLFGGALWAQLNHFVALVMHRLPEQHQREQEVATADVIHLEHRTVPRPAQRSRARPQPRPVPRPVTPLVPRVAVVPHPDVPHPVKATARPAPSAAPEIVHHVKQAPPLVTHRQTSQQVAAGAPAAHSHKEKLSVAELAQLNAQFAQTIAASHQDLATIQKRTEEQPVAIKRYPMQFAGLQATLQRGEGYIEPTTTGQRIGRTVWYYTHYTYMWPDGHLEDDDIPWPFRYPVNRDLFAMHIHLIPLQLPPPGFRVTRPLKPFLAHFLQTAGQG
jgi:hypothetical protein